MSDTSETASELDPERVNAMYTEVRMRVDEQRERRNALATRASVLIAATAVTAGLLDVGAEESLIALSTVFTVIAAGLGIYVLVPGKSKYPTLTETRDSFYTAARLEVALDALITKKMEYYSSVARRFERQGQAVRWGYVALGIGIALSALATVLGRA